MQWMRARHHDRTLFGTREGDVLRVHEGDLFGVNAPTGETLALAELHWLAPCTPGKIIGLWNNFGALAEKNGWARPAEPLYFLKSPGSVAAHGQPIEAPPAEVGRVVYEGELGLVIGQRARRITVEEASAHVFGYCCANDVTAIELLHRDASFPQWARAKSFDGFCAFGPVIETALDLAGARVRTRVGGRERQDYPLADMLFGPAELVARLSQDMTLEPGDLILCGTSVGVLPMKAGSEVEVEIDGIGVLANRYG